MNERQYFRALSQLNFIIGEQHCFEAFLNFPFHFISGPYSTAHLPFHLNPKQFFLP